MGIQKRHVQILHVLKEHQSLDKSSMEKLTGYSRVLLNPLIDQLEACSFVETTIGDSKGGRKPKVIRLKDNLLYALGIDLGTHFIRAVIIDNNCRIMATYSFEREPFNHPKLSPPDLMYIAEETLKHAGLSLQEIDTIGIGISGIVDEHKKECLFLNKTSEWRNLPVYEHLRDLFNNPYISVKDSTNTMAAAEKRLGQCLNDENFIYINIGMGIGASIYCHGSQVVGSSGISSEIGHIDIAPQGVMCCCGNLGCLESIAAGWAVAKRCKEALDLGTISKLNELENTSDLKVTDILNAALVGDKLAVALIRDSARIMAKGISMLINLFNPDKIILSGGVVKGVQKLYIDTLLPETQAHVLPWLRSNVKFSISELGEFDSALGAAITAIDEHFEQLITTISTEAGA